MQLIIFVKHHFKIYSTIYYIDVILPLALAKLYTYKITEAEYFFLKKGMRVAVEFGKSKIYTSLVYKVHTNPPVSYKPKDIFQILDEFPIVNEMQLNHWEWIADYYMCTLGEVYKAALPSAFLLESETEIQLVNGFDDEATLSNDEFLLFEALQHQPQLSIQQVMDILGKKTIFPVIKELIQKKAIVIKEQLYEQYKPKLVKYIRLHKNFQKPEMMEQLINSLKNAPKQRDLLLTYFQLKTTHKNIRVSSLKDILSNTTSILKSLVQKEIFEIYYIQTDRINYTGKTKKISKLSSIQQGVLRSIISQFKIKQTILLNGITSSGKTEIYIKLIEQELKKNKQVLYLLPEIALTTQLVERLQYFFGDYLSVFHSKFSINERVEVWNNVLQQKEKAQLIVGARSSLFLPFRNLGFIIVDEEHEPSFKQYDPSPRYHARDAAIVLAKQHKAKVLLGSATPSLESFYNTKQGKYGYVEINQRYGNVLLPDIELVNIKEAYRKKRMKGHFSERLLQLITETLEYKEQIILFQNRRGYAPVVECETCGNSSKCQNCDVSLTFHSYTKELRCHYCGYKQTIPKKCNACGSEHLNTKGFGTEQIEMELHHLFPNAKIGRMDLDTTRGKYSYQKIIGQFDAQEIDILVGTQMLSKGLDFSNVSLVGIMNADNMLNFPDFRAHERSYQLMVQVSGRSGRGQKRGKVIIQTFNPYHQILQQVSTSDYFAMYNEQLEERWQYKYPPFYRLIKITLKHKDFQKIETGVNWLESSLTNIYGESVMGPSVPSISKIRNYYIRNFTIKIPQKQSIKTYKDKLLKVKESFLSIKEFRSIKFNIDVDYY